MLFLSKSQVDNIVSIVITAGKISLKYLNNFGKIYTKNDNSPVTYADIYISNYLIENINNLGLGFQIISEEDEVKSNLISNNDFFWLIDPIDGTRNFIKGDDGFTINVALIYKKQALYGFIYQPMLDLLYYTDHNLNVIKSNMYKEDKIIKTEQIKRPDKGLRVIIGRRPINNKMKNFLKNNDIESINNISSSIKFCYLVENRADIYPKFDNLMEWDTAAGHALLKASCGNVNTMDKKELLYAKNSFQNPHFIAFSPYASKKIIY